MRTKMFGSSLLRFACSGNRLCIERLKGSTMERWKEEERPRITTAEERRGILNRRSFLEKGSVALALTAGIGLAQQTGNGNGDSHTGNNETQPGPVNKTIDALEPDSAFPPTTDAGGQPPFKYPFSYAHKRIEAGGWTRQVTVRELPISKKVAGVEMRLIKGGIRELHWHVGSEWAYMTAGSARITGVDSNGRAFVDDVSEGDVWLFPGGIPHSIQGLGPDGCQFLLVFNDGNFDEFETFLITDWVTHTPKDVLAKNFKVPASTFDNVPKRAPYIFQTELPGDLKMEQSQASQGTGSVPGSYAFRTGQMKPNKVTAGGEVKIID